MGGTMMAARDLDLSEMTMLCRLGSPDRRPNMLIVCSEAARESVTAQAARLGQPPVHLCKLPGPLSLPAACGTLLLSDVAAMGVRQQLVLYDWMSQHPGSRVMSLTSADLPALIRNAAFLEGLYYRLNTLRMEVQEQLPPLPAYASDRNRSLWS
jgi:transcriptional regulator of aromatic amino acid metabolism